MKNKAIGGYFELELPLHKEYHSQAIALNSGRHCLEYILKCRKYSKIYVPYFTCDAAVEPIIKLGIAYTFYSIDKDYHIADNINLLENEGLLYTNYWGIQNEYCLELSQKYGQQLIIDNSQAFYAKPINNIDTFYSCRKFFGVPDGGYLYTNAEDCIKLEQDISHLRMNSLIKRIDLSAEDGFADFRASSETFHTMPVLHMSKFTKRMMCSIDYSQAAYKRRKNYEYLRRFLGGRALTKEETPMIFPYKIEDGQKLREYLIRNKIFIAKYWPNVELWSKIDSLETWMANNILPLPIDQRYGEREMKQIIKFITQWNSEYTYAH